MVGIGAEQLRIGRGDGQSGGRPQGLYDAEAKKSGLFIFTDTDLKLIGIYYIVFILVDLLAATVGFLIDRREDWKLLFWLPLQRFGYRQLMYYVVLRSIATAIRGPFVGWGKLERHGTVKTGPAVRNNA